MDNAIIEQIDNAMLYVKNVAMELEALKTEIVKNLVKESQVRVNNNGMLDYKDLMKVTALNQTYVYKEIARIKRKYKLTYTHKALPVNIVAQEYGIAEDIIFQITKKLALQEQDQK